MLAAHAGLFRYLGLSLWWAWAYIVFYCDAAFPAIAPLGAPRMAWIASLFGYALAMTWCALFCDRIGSLASHRVALTWTQALSCVGTALALFAWAPGIPSPELMCVAGGLATGLGTAWLSLSWGELFGSMGIAATGRLVTASLFIGVALVYPMSLMPSGFCAALACLLPAASAAMLRLSTVSVPLRTPPPGGVYVSRPLPWGLMANIGAVSAAFGFLQGSGLVSGAVSTHVLFAGIVAASLALTIYTNALGRQIDVARVYRASLVVLLSGFMFMPFLAGLPLGIATSLVTAAYDCFDVMAWVLMANMVLLSSDTPAAAPFAWGRLSNHVGMLVGTAVGSAVASAGAVGMGVTVLSFLIMLCILASGSDVRFFSTPPEVVEKMSSRADGLEEACRKVVEDFGLTARESEVLVLMARGRNAAYISETLVISENTAKTHGKHIYRKMGVSSQQQLMDVVEARMAFDNGG